MSGPSVHLSLPPRSLLKFPPDSIPAAVPPPSSDFIRASPFAVDPKLYNDLLDVRVPLTIAAVYAVTVTLLNALNRKRENKPWAISKTRPFLVFVLLHNISLAIYSAITCAALFRALQQVWPGWDNKYGVAGALDALCKMHGPRGFGDAASFNSSSGVWEVKNRLIHLGEQGLPESTDVGRLWNEGLAFWGWLFYLSKFYEVLDTVIILAKGKRSSTLQTYHHAGAMLGMWAGIRYMSPPIWMFVLVNSGIHSLMYIYYALAAVGIRVPQSFKRSLTTLQIVQFLVGTTYALLHLIVSYTVPVSTPYTFVSTVTAAASILSSAASSGVTAAASSVATGGIGGILKKIAFRAAGEEGLAENVRDPNGNALGREASKVMDTVKTETRWRNEWHQVNCIDTSGQAFAILLNTTYLLPLTALFVRFFIRSYTRRISPKTKNPTQHHALDKSRRDAAKGVGREVESVGKAAESAIEPSAEAVLEESKLLAQKGSERLGDLKVNGAAAVEKAKKKLGEAMENGNAKLEAMRKRASKGANVDGKKDDDENEEPASEKKDENANPEESESPETNGEPAQADGPAKENGETTDSKPADKEDADQADNPAAEENQDGETNGSVPQPEDQAQDTKDQQADGEGEESQDADGEKREPSDSPDKTKDKRGAPDGEGDLAESYADLMEQSTTKE